MHTSNHDRPDSFQLKGALLPMNVLELRSTDIDSVKVQLQAKVEASPAFFKNGPIVFSFDALENHEGFKIEELIRFSRQLDLIPLGVKGANKGTESKARSLGLAKFSKGKDKPIDESPLDAPVTPTPPPSTQAQSEPEQPSQVSPEPPITKVITNPIRSGQQVYSAGDMIVLAAVSPGAEILAGGNIHVYAPLRGRALAGVHGDEQARIFCHKQEAELISIAGHFLNDEKLRSTHWNESAQIYFNGNELVVDKLTI